MNTEIRKFNVGDKVMIDPMCYKDLESYFQSCNFPATRAIGIVMSGHGTGIGSYYNINWKAKNFKMSAPFSPIYLLPNTIPPEGHKLTTIFR